MKMTILYDQHDQIMTIIYIVLGLFLVGLIVWLTIRETRLRRLPMKPVKVNPILIKVFINVFGAAAFVLVLRLVVWIVDGDGHMFRSALVNSWAVWTLLGISKRV